jgi:outer membrane protein assembly factor BamB
MKKSKLAKPLALIIIISMILTLAACSNPPPLNLQETGNTPGNIVNDGKIAQNDGWIYYRNQADHGSLYRIKIDGTGRQKLSDDAPNFINVVGDWVFYFNFDDRKVYKIDVNGRNREVVIEGLVSSVFVSDGLIYYRYDNLIYKLDIESNQKAQLNEDECGNIFVIDGWIYYNAFSGGLYKMRIDGTEKIKLTDNRCGPVFIVEDDWIYYVNRNDNDYIYRMRTDGTEYTLFISDRAEYINAAEGWVFYTNLDDDETIYRIRTDGTERERLNNDESYGIHVIGNWIYYVKWNTRSWRMFEENEIYRMRFDGSELERVT